jgi:uncharacterized protein (DUF433 family)
MWQDRITSDAAILGGKPIIKGTRISVEVVLEELASGTTPADLAKDFIVDEADIYAALEFAAQALRADALLVDADRR